MQRLVSAEIDLKVEFYDVDSMRIVWHGNYIRYMEQARCALLDLIGYNYNEMEAADIAWPIVDIHVKYISPLIFNQKFRVRATLVDWENRLKIEYLIFDPETGKKITKAHTVQMAVDMQKQESLFVTPPQVRDTIENVLDIINTTEAGVRG